MPTLWKFTILFDRRHENEKFYFYFVRHCFGTSEKIRQPKRKKVWPYIKTDQTRDLHDINLMHVFIFEHWQKIYTINAMSESCQLFNVLNVLNLITREEVGYST